MQYFHVFIMGFTQRQREWTGMEALREKAKQLDCVNRQNVELMLPLKWCFNTSQLAEYIFRHSTSPAETKVFIYAYSWGAGRGFVQLSAQLKKRGLKVNHAVLCDPVYHSWFRVWRGLFTFSWNPPIKVPSNVQLVDHFYQRNNVPQGASLLAADPRKTQIQPGQELDYTHQYMDDAVEYHDKVLSVITSKCQDRKCEDSPIS